MGRDYTVAPDLAADAITGSFELLPALAKYDRTLARLAGTGQTLHSTQPTSTPVSGWCVAPRTV
jgi:hypothetical protein